MNGWSISSQIDGNYDSSNRQYCDHDRHAYEEAKVVNPSPHSEPSGLFAVKIARSSLGRFGSFVCNPVHNSPCDMAVAHDHV
jgi:hypothetical protein